MTHSQAPPHACNQIWKCPEEQKCTLLLCITLNSLRDDHTGGFQHMFQHTNEYVNLVRIKSSFLYLPNYLPGRIVDVAQGHYLFK